MNKTVRLVCFWLEKNSMPISIGCLDISILQNYLQFFSRRTLHNAHMPMPMTWAAHPYYWTKCSVSTRARKKISNNLLPNQNDTLPVVAAIVAARVHEMGCSQLAIFAMIVSIANFMTTILMLIHFARRLCLSFRGVLVQPKMNANRT